jgi:ABC-type transport system substrate-binding protein
MKSNNGAIDDCGEITPSRRKLLALAAASGAAGLAGCGGGGDPGTPTDQRQTSTPPLTTATPEASSGEPVDDSIDIRVSWSFQPDDANFNIFAASSKRVGSMFGHYYPRLGQPMRNGEFMTMVTKDIEIDGCDVISTYHEGWKWWDGTDVTAEDVHKFYVLRDYILNGAEAGVSNQPSSHKGNEVLGKYKYKAWMGEPQASLVAKRWGNRYIRYHPDWAQPWVERFEDATTEEEISDVQADFGSAFISYEDIRDEGYGYGLYRPTEFTATKVVHEKFADHPRADWTNVDTVTLHIVPENQVFRQRAQQGDFDFGGNSFKRITNKEQLGISAVKQLPESASGTSMYCNFYRKHIKRRSLRRAIALVTDHKLFETIWKQGYKTDVNGIRTQTHMNQSLGEKYCGANWLDTLIDYGYRGKPERATEILEADGFEKQGNQWIAPDGDPVDLTLKAGAGNSDQVSVLSSYAKTLSEFGIKTNLVAEEGSVFSTNTVRAQNPDADLILFNTSGPHPEQFYRPRYPAGGLLVGLGDFDSAVADDDEPPVEEGECSQEMLTYRRKLDRDTGVQLGQPVRPTIPKTVGAWQVEEGDGQTAYPLSWHGYVASAQSDEQLRTYTRKLAWLFNFQLPQIDLWFGAGGTAYGDTANFEFRSRDLETLTGTPANWLMGWIDGKTQ